MLRLASDADVNGEIIRGLRRRLPEIDLLRVRDCFPEGTSDPEVLAWSAAENRVLITMDVRRFANMVATPPGGTPGLVVVRMGTFSVGAVCDRVRSFLVACNPMLVRGALMILEPTKTRRRT